MEPTQLEAMSVLGKEILVVHVLIMICLISNSVQAAKNMNDHEQAREEEGYIVILVNHRS